MAATILPQGNKFKTQLHFNPYEHVHIRGITTSTTTVPSGQKVDSHFIPNVDQQEEDDDIDNPREYASAPEPLIHLSIQKSRPIDVSFTSSGRKWGSTSNIDTSNNRQNKSQNRNR